MRLLHQNSHVIPLAFLWVCMFFNLILVLYKCTEDGCCFLQTYLEWKHYYDFTIHFKILFFYNLLSYGELWFCFNFRTVKDTFKISLVATLGIDEGPLSHEPTQEMASEVHRFGNCCVILATIAEVAKTKSRKITRKVLLKQLLVMVQKCTTINSNMEE